MNERLTHHETSGEKLDLTDLVQEKREAAQEAAKHAETAETHDVERLQQKALEQAVSGREYARGEHEATPPSHTFGTHKELKAQSYKQTMRHVRSKLNWAEKGFSKHIHGSATEKAAAVGSKTIARPWGLLMGGLCAFVGSFAILLMANHFGYRYNFSLFLLLFLGGYLFGSLLELIMWVLRRKGTYRS